MDEEELEQPKNKKITLSNFFESIVSIDKLANRALSTANSNLNIIQEQKLLIESLSMSLEGCLLYTSPSPRDRQKSRMPSSA